MPNYIFLALLAALFYSLAGIAGKVATKHKFKNLFALLFWVNLITLTFVPVLIIGGGLQNPLPALWPLIITSSAVFIALVLMWWAVYRMDVSAMQPLFSTQTLFVALLAFLILGERYPFQIYAWIGLIIIGGILVTYEEKMRFKGFFKIEVAALLGAILFGSVANIVTKIGLESGINPWNFTIWTAVIVAVLWY